MRVGRSGTGAERCEILKLAALLNVDADELEFLAQLPADDLRRFRDDASDRLNDIDISGATLLIQAAQTIPLAVVAPLAERTLGPALSACITPQLDIDRAVELARRFKAPFLGRCSGRIGGRQPPSPRTDAADAPPSEGFPRPGAEDCHPT